MSLKEYKDYIVNNMLDKEKNNKYFTLIYKPNINKKEKQEIIKKLKEDRFPFDDEKDYKKDIIRIFGKHFVKQNKNKCKITYKNKKYKLKEYLNKIDNNYSQNINKIKLKIIGINNITDFTDMFHGCIHLLSVSENKNDIQQYISIDIFNKNNSNCSSFEEQKLDNINELNSIDFNYECNDSFNLYYGCNIKSMEYISSVSKKGSNYNYGNSDNKINSKQDPPTNNNKIQYMRRLFSGCYSLISIPDISKWNTSNVTDMGGLFEECNSLISIPYISKWNTSNVINISFMFNKCNSLISLPDISQWVTSNITDISFMFNECKSLISLPDISKWNTSNITDISFMFNECKSLISLPDISKWDTSNVINISFMFNNCNSLISIPDISKF